MLEDFVFGSRKNRQHNKREKQRRDNYTSREFLFWDGEGVGGHDGDEEAQKYVLFGASTTAGHYPEDMITGQNLSTRECLQLILDVADAHPKAIHVAFAFDYDVNMILKDLSPEHFSLLHKNGRVRWQEFDIEHVPHKWFTVTVRPIANDPWNDATERRSVKIADIFGFFQCSFLKALKSYLTDHELMIKLDIVEAGKSKRNQFTYADLAMIVEYWALEAQLGATLITELRRLMLEADLKITAWHGPGAIANHVYRRHSISEHMIDPPESVLTASQYAYAGGRFELFRIGRHVGPVYSMDINSAYPWGISQLPSLTEGCWRQRGAILPRWDNLAEFGVYRVSLRAPLDMRKPAPLFYRSEQGNISYPTRLDGWYWTPEVEQLIKYYPSNAYRIEEGWEYLGWQSRPFQFVAEYYARRRDMKAKGIGAEKAIKLALNSLYGKMAQRVGWEHSGTAPKWHQLNWAGWVTSKTRATLFDLLARIPWQHQIAVETDGIYTTYDPALLGLENSPELGEWEIKSYGELMYLQSGIYALGKTAGLYGDTSNWTVKYRGLDKGALSPQSMADYLQQATGPDWQPITGPDTRFVGYPVALANEDKFLATHRRWRTLPNKEIAVGSRGKRVHRGCKACTANLTAYEQPHDLQIASAAYKQPLSTMHHIPWRDTLSEPTWRLSQTNQLIGV